MTLIFELILLTSILVIGWTIITQPEMGLYFLREWAETKESKLLNATMFCHWCMPSSWSLIGYLFAALIGLIDSFSWSLVFMYPIVVCGSSFLCGLLWAVYKKIEIETKYYHNEEQNVYFNLKDRKARYKRETSNNH